MSSHSKATRRRLIKRIITITGIVALVTAMALGTRVLSTEDSVTAGGVKFSAAEFAVENYESMIAPSIEENAVDAVELAAAITADVDEAGAEFGGRDGQSAWAFPVQFTGVAGEVNPVNGNLPVSVDGFPADVQLIVQTGPAVNGSALRDVTGEISFGMFANQLEFQSVSVELNNQVKVAVLADLDAASLNGRTITVVGAFAYGNPAAWIVTPIEIEVE